MITSLPSPTSGPLPNRGFAAFQGAAQHLDHAANTRIDNHNAYDVGDEMDLGAAFLTNGLRELTAIPQPASWTPVQRTNFEVATTGIRNEASSMSTKSDLLENSVDYGTEVSADMRSILRTSIKSAADAARTGVEWLAAMTAPQTA
jgi:hypothetical protein